MATTYKDRLRALDDRPARRSRACRAAWFRRYYATPEGRAKQLAYDARQKAARIAAGR